MVPASVYAEVLVRPTRVGAEEVARIERFFDELPIQVQPVDRTIAAVAARLRARTTLRLGDAFVLATAEVLPADSVLTADRRWRKLDARVELI